MGWALGRVGRGPLIAVDWWYGGKDVAELLEAAEMPGDTPAQIGAKRKRDFERTLGEMGLAEHTRIIAALSWDAPAQIPEPLAFCFIDACHDDAAIIKDIKAWTPKIVPGGIIVYHDYGTWKCPQIKQRVDQWQEKAKWEPLGLVSSAMAYRRPE